MGIRDWLVEQLFSPFPSGLGSGAFNKSMVDRFSCSGGMTWEKLGA